MSFKTLNQITDDVVKRIGLVSGAAVQKYTEPQIKVGVQDAFDFLFRKRFWDHLTDWYTYTLDGVNGWITTNISDICAEYNDIQYVHNSDQSVIVKAENTDLLYVQNTQAQYWSPIKFTAGSNQPWQSRVIKFWPPTATGDVTMRIRTHPGVFSDDDIIPFPQDIIGWAAAWMVLETDGLNPGNANKSQAMFDISYQDYMQNINDQPIGHGGAPRNVSFTFR